MKIAIDARAMSHPQPGGFKTYTTSLIRGLLELDQINTYCLFFDRTVNEVDLSLTREVQSEIIGSRSGIFAMPFREQILLPSALNRGKFDVFHAPCATGPLKLNQPTVVTIHDAIEFKDARLFGLPVSPNQIKRSMMTAYNRLAQRQIARQAKVIITDSFHSKNDLIEILRVDENKIRVVSIAQSPDFQLAPSYEVESFRKRIELPETFVLSLVSASPRKNAIGLLNAYARLPESIRQIYPLVIVWTHELYRSDVSKMVESLDLTSNIRFLSGVTDKDLVLLYNAASFFVFPSLYEGFGLPVLEAMACGTPVVASNLTSIPEVAGDAAELVDPRDIEAFTTILERVLLDSKHREYLREKGIKRASEFSWEKTAKMTLDVYQEVFDHYS